MCCQWCGGKASIRLTMLHWLDVIRDIYLCADCRVEYDKIPEIYKGRCLKQRKIK